MAKSQATAKKCGEGSRYLIQYPKRWLTAALIAGGALPLLSPIALSAGTTAGTTINNTATATYQDPNNPGTTLNATSNTITITVAEVAGIALISSGITEAPNAANPVANQGNGVIDSGDIVYFDYTLTNVGNDPTQFFIPGAPSQVLGGTATGSVQIVAVNGAAVSVNVPAPGSTTGALAGLPNGGSFAPGDTLKVRVSVQVTANTSGAPIKVVFGDTGLNDNSAGTQNQPYIANASNLDVYTSDNPDPSPVTGEVVGTPINGDAVNHRQEASASQQTFLASTPRAFATVLKTAGNFTAGSNGTTAPNGTLTYGLGLRVEQTSPDASVTPADLQGTTLTIDGAAVNNRVLVSDVIPTNTTLLTTGIVKPGNWTVVYSGSDPATTTALTAQWFTNPASAGTIRRIGFVYDANPVANGGQGPIARGTVLTNAFQFNVTTNVAAGSTIANIAQVFGQTNPAAGQPLVYDESGDAQPNNYNADNTPGPFSNVTPTDFNNGVPGAGQTASDANEHRGIANPATQGIDNANTNTGQGPGGEDTSYAVQGTNSILNGPNGQPAAVGPTSNNDDFTYQSTALPANPAPGTTFDPGQIVFTNTVNNASATTLNNILLRPLTPAVPTDLPDGTIVIIALGGNTGTYTYSGGQFTLTAGTPIAIPSLAAGVSLNYTTTVNLPAGTPLSTDLNRGFPVPVVAYIDGNGNGQYDVGTDTGNVTIDRLYTGYLKLTKLARILDANGAPVAPASGYTNDATLLNPFIRPGNTIEYQIQYKNISEVSAGTGNVVLNAGSVVITEDGQANLPTNTNNWFSTTNSPTRDSIFPANPNGSAVASAGAVTVTVQNNDIRIYVNTVGTVVPSGSAGAANGSLTFQRKIN